MFMSQSAITLKSYLLLQISLKFPTKMLKSFVESSGAKKQIFFILTPLYYYKINFDFVKAILYHR